MTLREAIDARHSVRVYKNQPLTEDIVKTLEEQITICNKKGKLHIQLILNEPKAFQGTLAKYGKFRNVSNYIVMAGQTSNDLDERIDKLNQADSMIFSTENFLNENGDKLPADQRPAIDSALQQLKDAHKNGDIAAIDTAISMGIIAKAFKSSLDVTDNAARQLATRSLLDEVDWSETSSYKQGLTRHWTEMFSQDMTISQALMETLTLAAGGRVGISTGGGGGSSSELTNWDGTKKKTGWGM